MTVFIAGVVRLSWLFFIIYAIRIKIKKRKMAKADVSLEKEKTEPIKRTMGYTWNEAIYCERQLPAYLKYLYPTMKSWKMVKHYPTYYLAMTNRVAIVLEDGSIIEKTVSPELVRDVVYTNEKNEAVFNKAQYWMRVNNPNGFYKWELSDSRNSGDTFKDVILPLDYSDSDINELAKLFEQSFAFVKAHLIPMEEGSKHRTLRVEFTNGYEG